MTDRSGFGIQVSGRERKQSDCVTRPSPVNQTLSKRTGEKTGPLLSKGGSGLGEVTADHAADKILKRLRIQQIFGALALILTGAFMFTTRGNEWIACLTIAAVLELYTAFRIPQEEAKEEK